MIRESFVVAYENVVVALKVGVLSPDRSLLVMKHVVALKHIRDIMMTSCRLCVIQEVST